MTQQQYAKSQPPPKVVYGWAVIDQKGIRIRSVSDTRRAAVVNYLVTDRCCTILNGMTDEQIERLWAYHRNGAEVEIITVQLPPTQEGGNG